jgi:iron complex outermembrane receptor protein
VKALRLFVRSLLIAGFLLTTESLAGAQAPLSGRVVDAQGATVAGAEITVLGSGGASRGTRSAADGSFTVTSVPAGDLQLLVHAPGFAESTQTVRAGDAALTITLQVAGLTDNVTVQGALLGTAATGKTNLPLRDIPMTVHGVPGRVIQEQAANDLTTALQNVSGVNAFTQYGIYEAYTFRGFLDLFPSQAVQLVDGVRQEGNRLSSQLTNIERVEVLKGPSSVLYGGSALGATVNLIRKKPTAQPAYDFSAAAGSWGLGRGSFGATGRLKSDQLLYRLDVGGESREGYRHNDARRVQVTPSVAWRVTPKDQVNVYYTFNRNNFAGDSGIPMLNTDFGGLTADSRLPDVPRDRNYRTPFDDATAVEHNLQVAYARQFNNTFGFRNTLSYRAVNDDYFVAEFLVVDGDRDVYREYLQFTHHRRPLMNLAEVTGRFTRGIEQNVVLGWEAQRYNNHTDTIPGGGVAEAEYIDLYNPVETQQDITRTIARRAYFTNKTNALYFQDNLTLGPKVKAMVGGRFDIFRRTSHNNPVSNGVETEGPLLRREAEAFTGRAGLVYQPAPVLDLYGSVATSFSPLTQAQPDGSSLEPERGRQFEFGQRLHLAGDRVQVNTSIYSINRENIAFSRPGGVFIQAGDVRSRGFEADVQTTPVSNWRVTGGYAFTAAEFVDFPVSATVNLAGNTPIFAPRHTFNLWTGYDWPSGLGVNVGVRALSSQFGDRDNVFRIDGYGLVNVGVRYARGPLEYALNVNNLTSTDYIASTLYDSQVYPGEPINVLGTLRVRLR